MDSVSTICYLRFWTIDADASVILFITLDSVETSFDFLSIALWDSSAHAESSSFSKR